MFLSTCLCTPCLQTTLERACTRLSDVCASVCKVTLTWLAIISRLQSTVGRALPHTPISASSEIVSGTFIYWLFWGFQGKDTLITGILWTQLALRFLPQRQDDHRLLLLPAVALLPLRPAHRPRPRTQPQPEGDQRVGGRAEQARVRRPESPAQRPHSGRRRRDPVGKVRWFWPSWGRCVGLAAGFYFVGSLCGSGIQPVRNVCCIGQGDAALRDEYVVWVVGMLKVYGIYFGGLMSIIFSDYV